MRTKCAIMQPTYLPWLGYFSLIDQVDKFIFLDSVQLSKRSWQVRNRIKSNNKEILLTVPILKDKSRSDMVISSAAINYDEKWIYKHLNSFLHNYSKSRYFDEIYMFLNNILSQKYKSIGELNIIIIINICKKIGIDTKFYQSSNLGNIHGKRDELLVSICKEIDSDWYISAHGSYSYIEKDNSSYGGIFSDNNITIEYQNYVHPNYYQIGRNFIPYLSIVDLLFNYGFSNTLEVVRKGNDINFTSKDMRKIEV